jgi:GNAT superfamily N-acetyltransferase
VTVGITQTSWDDPDVRRLTAEQQRELRVRYDGAAEPGTPLSATDVSVVVVARRADGVAVGCGALRALAADVAELKRMYVVPAARGHGLAKRLLAALESEAGRRGWTTLRLETGPRQPEAVALYEGAGYRPIEAFGAYVGAAEAEGSLFYERIL